MNLILCVYRAILLWFWQQLKPRFGYSGTLAPAASELSALSTRHKKLGEAVQSFNGNSVCHFEKAILLFIG